MPTLKSQKMDALHKQAKEEMDMHIRNQRAIYTIHGPEWIREIIKLIISIHKVNHLIHSHLIQKDLKHHCGNLFDIKINLYVISRSVSHLLFAE